MTEKLLLIVVDDEPDIAELVADTAEMAGFEAMFATNVPEFLRLEKDHSPDVVVTDLCIPQMDGIELLQALSDRKCRSGIILMSGYRGRYIPLAEGMMDGLNLTHLGSIEKPFRIAQLKEKLQEAAKWCIENRAAK